MCNSIFGNISTSTGGQFNFILLFQIHGGLEKHIWDLFAKSYYTKWIRL